MALSVEIEKHSGFCGGVIRAIGRAEKFLDESPSHRLYSLGAIVHNEAELKRLGEKGLVTIGKDSLDNLQESASGEEKPVLLIRAHGEPPDTYSKASQMELKVIDCTCPVVLKLQKSIREAHERLSPAGGRLVIFGKIGHAEVLGLLGQVGGDAVVIEDLAMLSDALREGLIPTDRPIEVFSQTTKSPAEYSEICRLLLEKTSAEVKVHQTICSQVASRYSELSDFSASHDAILFVSGASSSNGKVLCDLCKSRNPRTWHISSPEEVRPEWFKDNDRVGICGATSTPRWLLESVARAVSE